MKNRFFLFLTIIYAGGILWFSLQPDYSLGGKGSVWMQAFKNFLHIPAYAGLAGLMMLSMQGLRIKDQGLGIRDKGLGIRDEGLRIKDQGLRIGDQGSRSRDQGSRSKEQEQGFYGFISSIILHPSSLTFVIATSYGVLNEFVQANVPGRFYSIGDMVRNAIGALIGIWLFWKFGRGN